MRRTTTDSSALPDVELPSLTGLRVQVPLPAAVESAELQLRFEQLRREHGTERARGSGEKIRAGDEVLVDLAVFVDGHVVPRSARADLWLDAPADLFLPGLRDQLVGTAIDSSQAVELVLPRDYPVADLAGRYAVLAVAVRGARTVQLPAPESPALLKAIGLGATLDDTMDALVAEISAERTEATRELARALALRALAGRCQIEVPARLVASEIEQRFARDEGAVLSRLGCPPDEIERARQAWLADAELRAEVAEAVRNAVLLRSVVRAKKMELAPADVKDFLEGFAQATGERVQELRDQLLHDEAAKADLYQSLLQLKALEYVMSQTEIRVPGVNS